MPTMSKRRNYDNSRREAKTADEKRKYDSSNRTLAPPCQACKALRESSGRENDTRIYGASGSLRYIKCHVCGVQTKKTIHELLRQLANRGSDTDRADFKTTTEAK